MCVSLVWILHALSGGKYCCKNILWPFDCTDPNSCPPSVHPASRNVLGIKCIKCSFSAFFWIDAFILRAYLLYVLFNGVREHHSITCGLIYSTFPPLICICVHLSCILHAIIIWPASNNGIFCSQAIILTKGLSYKEFHVWSQKKNHRIHGQPKRKWNTHFRVLDIVPSHKLSVNRRDELNHLCKLVRKLVRATCKLYQVIQIVISLESHRFLRHWRAK